VVPRRHLNGAKVAVGAVDGDALLSQFGVRGVEGPHKGQPPVVVGVAQHQETGDGRIDSDGHLVGGIVDSHLLSLAIGLAGERLGRRETYFISCRLGLARLLLEDDHLPRVEGAQRLASGLGVGDHLGSRHDKGSRQGVVVAIDAHLIVVYQGIPGPVDAALLRRHDIARVEHIQQGRIQRLGVLVDQRRDAIVGQLGLRLDELHVLYVLLGDDRVIAAHIMQVIHHGRVGVQRFLAAAHQRRNAKRPLLRQQVVDRRCAIGHQGGVHRRQERLADDEQLGGNHGHSQGPPPSRSADGSPQQHHAPRQQQGHRKDEQIAELVGVEHATVGKGLLGLGQARQRPLRQRGDPFLGQEAQPQAGQPDRPCAQGNPGQDRPGETPQAAAPASAIALGGRRPQGVAAHPRQQAHHQGVRVDPAKRRVHLAHPR